MKMRSFAQGPAGMAVASSLAVLSVLSGGPALAEDSADAQPTQFDEVVVTAPKMSEPLVVETDPRSPRQPVPPADGAGYLKSIPGFTVARQGGIDGDPLLRGQGGSRLNVLLDNTPLLGGCPNRMDPPTSYIFPESFDRLTVLKGPQSVVHGGTSLGTVLVERETQRFDHLSARGNASALYGSFDRNDEVIDLSGGAKPGYVRLLGTHSSSDDYQDGNGNAVHSNYSRESGTAIVGWTPDNDTALELSVDHSEAEAASAARMMDGSQFDRDGANLKFTKSNLSPLVGKVQANAYYNYVDHVMDVYSLRPLVLPAMGSTTMASQVDHLMQGGKASVELTPTASTKLTFGADYNHDEHTRRTQNKAEYVAGTSLDSKERLRDVSFDTVAAFGELEQQLTAVDRVIAGYRLTQVDATKHNLQPNLDDSRSLNSGFGRYERDVDIAGPVTAFVGLGHVERAPDYWERNVNSSVVSFNAATEKTNQLDVGALFARQKWRGSLSSFYARTDDYILVPSTRNTNVKNVDAHTWGGEAELSYRFLPSWTAEATAAYVRGTNDSESKPLAQTPPLDTTLAVKYDDGIFLGGLLLRAVAAQDRTDPGWGNIISQDLGSTGGFAVWSANAGWRITESIKVTGGIDNIFDKTYAEHVSKTGTSANMMGTGDLIGYGDTVRVNEPGRTFWMKGTVKF